jgi:hypothetical protein
VAKQGRHRYFRLASREIGQMLEGVTLVAALHAPPRHRPSTAADEALRFARTCYDHLAGRLGVQLTDAMTAAGHLELGEEGGTVTHSGELFFRDLGLDLDALQRQKRRFCRPCLDWSERRMHLAGALGASLTTHFFSKAWLVRLRDSRAVALTPRGRQAVRERFGLALSSATGVRDRSG